MELKVWPASPPARQQQEDAAKGFHESDCIDFASA